MKYNTNRSSLSRNFLENLQNANRLSDNTITGPIEVGISRIAVNFGKISQNPLNFAARVGLGTVQKIDFLGGVA